MNNNEIMKTFTFQTHAINIIDKQGEPWFVGKDVASILGYSSTEKMTRRLDDDEKADLDYRFVSPEKGCTNPMARKATIINESGLYNAVFGSYKPEAKAFRKWVTSEVLPSIRKNRVYITDEFIEEAIRNPGIMSELIIKIRNERKTNKRLTSTIDRLSNIDGLLNLTAGAKLIGMRPKMFIDFLKLNKFVYESNGVNVAYARYLTQGLGWFDVKEVVTTSSYGEVVRVQTMITGKGIVELTKLTEGYRKMNNIKLKQ
jgi:anti-repressor protein